MGQAQSAADAYNCASQSAPQDTKSRAIAATKWQQDEMALGSKRVPISGAKSGRQLGSRKGTTTSHATTSAQIEHVRKLSIVSNRNIQLLSMKPRSERDNYADGLRSRRRSSLINMILGAPSSGPRFSDDLYSLNSHMSDLCQNFGIDYFPDASTAGLRHQNSTNNSPFGTLKTSSIASSSIMHLEDGSFDTAEAKITRANKRNEQQQYVDARLSKEGADLYRHHRRRSSLGSLNSFVDSAAFAGPGPVLGSLSSPAANKQATSPGNVTGDLNQAAGQRQVSRRRRSSFCPTPLASIDLTSSFDETSGTRYQQGEGLTSQDGSTEIKKGRPPPLIRTKRTMPGVEGRGSSESGGSIRTSPGLAGRNLPAETNCPEGQRTNHSATRRMLHRSGSELSLYSSLSASSANLSHHQLVHNSLPGSSTSSSARSSCHGRRMSRLCCGSSVFADNCQCSAGGGGSSRARRNGGNSKTITPLEPSDGAKQTEALMRETKLIIMLQVCLPFILAGFGNMAAGLVLNKVAQWKSFQHVPIFFVLLPSFIGLKGNIEMTLASRLSTLANLNLLATSYQRRRAYLSNLILILSQAIGLSLFAAFASMLCEFSMGKLELGFRETLALTTLVVLPCALVTSMVLVFISSIVMWWSVWLATLIRVNPDNLSTLLAAMYGDVSCVLTYGLFAELMYSCHQQHILIWPVLIICIALASWPVLWYVAFKFKETHELSLSSMPPMLTGIVVSLGSGTVLSLVVGRFSRIALYQPVVNGFGANLIAVQASRVSTWLWCGALRRLSSVGPESTDSELVDGSIVALESRKLTPSRLGTSLASFTGKPFSKQMISEADNKRATETVQQAADGSSAAEHLHQLVSQVTRGAGLVLRVIKILLWSFLNSSPNSVAARLLLIMMIPAHTLYFFVIWLLSPANYVILTWPFYVAYIMLCLTQVFILLLICEPLMTFLMRRHLDPDIFGISLLMALADLVGTLCLTGAFWLLARLGDPNAF